jgi:protein-S-isoprenylcysteine O-methyltransferase Ste14
MKDIPLLLVTATAWIYWGRVGAMIVRARRRRGDLSGLVPQQALERWLWIVWVPVVVAWIALPLLALTRAAGPFAVPDWARAEPLYAALRWAAAAGAIYSLAMTLKCWARMGRNWRMDVRTDDHADLITDGPFAHVRHPIYALGMLMMTCTAAVVATLPTAIAAVLLVVLTNIKARNEERFLLSSHGPRYASYMQTTGRFFPHRPHP